MKRIILIVLDSVGVGGAPDAARYGDEGSDTIGNTAKVVGGLHLPHMESLGLGRLTSIPGVKPALHPKGAYGKMQQQSAGKDSTTGHWEIAGVIMNEPFPTYPQGFPRDLLQAFEEQIGRKTIGNKPASGTEIIAQLGEEHMQTGFPIVYTSADSVFQIAAHEDVISLEDLYDYCRKARALLQGEHAVGRVIARPFVGQPGQFVRTAGRLDFSLEPPEPTVLDRLMTSRTPVYAVGKVGDLFAGRGISKSFPTGGNDESIDTTIRLMQEVRERSLIFTNLVDFDVLYGHRNDPEGYAKALEHFDRRLPEIINEMAEGDIVIITADHGCDPTTPSTDHSRERVPLLVYGDPIQQGIDLGVRPTFADLAETIAQFFEITPGRIGTGFLHDVTRPVD